MPGPLQEEWFEQLAGNGALQKVSRLELLHCIDRHELLDRLTGTSRSALQQRHGHSILHSGKVGSLLSVPRSVDRHKIKALHRAFGDAILR